MEITERRTHEIVVLQLAGRLDTNTAELVQDKLLATVGDGPIRLVIDLAGVNYVSSIGLRVLMIAAKRVAVLQGKMLLCGLAGHVRQVFDLAGFASVVPIFADEEAAVAALS